MDDQVLPARCQSTRKPYYYVVRPVDSGPKKGLSKRREYQVIACHPLHHAYQRNTNLVDLPGTITSIADGVSRLCPHCDRTSMTSCHCGTTFCTVDGGGTVVCPTCSESFDCSPGPMEATLQEDL